MTAHKENKSTKEYFYPIVGIAFGVLAILSSFIATAGDSYSALWGDMWAIVCFTGLAIICVSASVITWSEISKLKSSASNNLIKRQVLGCVFIVNFIAFWCLSTVIMRSNELTMDDGGGRRFVFLIGLSLLVVFTLLNLLYGAVTAMISSRSKKS